MMILTLCLALGALASTQARVLQLKEVTEVMAQVTQPYVINKVAAENFTATSTDKLMVHLALIPDKLERAHYALMEAMKGAMTQAQIAEQSTMGVASGIVGISTTLQSLRKNCPTNRFLVDPAQIHPDTPHPQLAMAGSVHQLPDMDIDDIMQKYKGISAADHESMARAVMAKLLKPTTGTGGLQKAILELYGDHAMVSLKDVLFAVDMVAKKVEAERMHNLRTRFEKVNQASRHVFGAYSHAAGLEAVTQMLQGLVTGVDHSSGALAHLQTFTDGIRTSLQSISCDRD